MKLSETLLPFEGFRLRDGSYVIITEDGRDRRVPAETYYALRRGDLSAVPRDVKAFVSAERFAGAVDNLSTMLLRSPTRFFVYSVTSLCNGGCIYCHAGSPRATHAKKWKKMDEDLADKMLDFIATVPHAPGTVVTLVTEGGEPLTNFDIIRYIYEQKERVEKQKRIKIVLDVVTNLTLMDETIASEFMAWMRNGDFRFASSLDGPKKIHDYQRRLLDGRPTYDIVTHWLRYFYDNYGYAVPLLPVVTGYTIKEASPQEVLAEYLKWRQRHFFFKIVRLIGDAYRKYDLYATPDRFIAWYKELIETAIQWWREGKRISERITNIFVDNILSPSRFSMCYRQPCGAGINILSFTEDGRIVGCDALRSISHRHTLGRLGVDDYFSVLDRAIGHYFDRTFVQPTCMHCPFRAYCNVCMDTKYGEHMNTWYVEPGNIRCAVYKGIFEYLFNVKYLEGDKWDVLVEMSRTYTGAARCTAPQKTSRTSLRFSTGASTKK